MNMVNCQCKGRLLLVEADRTLTYNVKTPQLLLIRLLYPENVSKV